MARIPQDEVERLKREVSVERLALAAGVELVEVWVENAYLVEVLDPAQMADYRRAMTVENWKRVFGLSESGAEQS